VNISERLQKEEYGTVFQLDRTGLHFAVKKKNLKIGVFFKRKMKISEKCILCVKQ